MTGGMFASPADVAARLAEAGYLADEAIATTAYLAQALKRRCLYLHLGYPAPDRERDIVLARVPGIEAELAEQLVRTVGTLRDLEIKKAPSIAETIDWARTLLALGLDDLDEAAVARTLGVVLKHVSDQERAVRELGLRG